MRPHGRPSALIVVRDAGERVARLAGPVGVGLVGRDRDAVVACMTDAVPVAVEPRELDVVGAVVDGIRKAVAVDAGQSKSTQAV